MKQELENAEFKKIKLYMKENNLTIVEKKELLHEIGRTYPLKTDRIFRSFMLDKKGKLMISKIVEYAVGKDKVDYKDLMNNIVHGDPFNGVYDMYNKANTSDLKLEIKNNIILIEVNTSFNKYISDKNSNGLYKTISNSYSVGEKYAFKDVYLININYEGGKYYKSNKGDPYREEYFTMSSYGYKVEDNVHRVNLWLDLLEEKYYNKAGKLKEEIKLEEIPEIHKIFLLISSTYVEDIERIYESMGEEYMEEKELHERYIKARDEYEAYLAEHDQEIIEDMIRMAAEEEGHEKGMKKGFKQGIEKGIEQGIDEGTQKNQKEVIKNMIDNNFDYEIISKCVNLSVEEIEKIVSDFDA